MSNFVPEKVIWRGSLITFFHLKKNAAESYRLLVEAYGEHAPSQDTCERWFARFRSGDFDVKDKERPGQPKKFKDEELQALLDENSCLTQKELALELGVERRTIGYRLHAMGLIRKLGKWVPHTLNENQLKVRIDTCKKHLADHKKRSVFDRIVTGDENWIYYDNPKRKAAYVSPGQPGPSQPKQDIHCQKVMLCIWWDQTGVVYYEVLESNQTVSADLYVGQLDKLAKALVEKRGSKAQTHNKVLFHDDNARPHRANITKNKVEELGWDRFDRPPYSPDLAPSDYHLFRSMQTDLYEKRFRNAEEVRKWVDEWIASKDKDFFKRGIHKLPRRWLEVIANEGQYIG